MNDKKPTRNMFFCFLDGDIAIQMGAPRQLHFSVDNIGDIVLCVWPMHACTCIQCVKHQPSSDARG